MIELSVVFPYYRNPRMLARQLLLWRDEWPSSLKERVEVVVVDDGSPVETAQEVVQGWRDLPRFSLYRVKEDRLWHQHGARNLGAHVAKADWMLMTDMDHLVPPATLAEVLRLLPEMKSNVVLTFGRVDAPADRAWMADDAGSFARTVRDDGSLKPHVNSFVVSRKRYWKLGGYDEDYCGLYGTDKLWRDRLYGVSADVRHLDMAPLIRVDRSVIDDASTRDVERKIKGRNSIKKSIALRKWTTGHYGKTTTLNFPWERIEL